MPKRAAICIGVDRAGSMPPLRAAAEGAKDFAAWAATQGCDTVALTDENGGRVLVDDVFTAIQARVAPGTYSQLIVYFAGHGFLSAPDAEYWLLSRAPENPNEAVNLTRAIEDARNCSIPHVIFVSDACRSAANGHPLSGVTGGRIFPNAPYRPVRGEIDVFFATNPGDTALELPREEAASGYAGIFTETLLESVTMPSEDLVEQIPGPPLLDVITTRKLKPLLESSVPLRAADHDVRNRQRPEVRPGTALPQYFAAVEPASIVRGLNALPAEGRGQPTLGNALRAIRPAAFSAGETPSPPRDVNLAARLGLHAEMGRLHEARGRARFETRTGFSLHGAQPRDVVAGGWRVDPAFEENGAWHWRVYPGPDRPHSSSVVLVFETAAGVRGIALAVLPDFIGSVLVDDAGRVLSVNYVPSQNSWRYQEYQQREAEIEEMKAYVAVAARHGRFQVPPESAAKFANRIRQDKGLDPTLGLYAAYAYAQAGRYEDAHSVFRYMRDDALPVPFDVAMLATRVEPACAAGRLTAPFAPMLSQGWALLAEGDPMFRPIHQELRAHLVPSLWTTLTSDGVAIAERFLQSETTP